MRLSFFLLACFAVHPLVAASSPDPCASTKLPTGVEQLLKQKYPAWRPKTVSDLEAYDQKLWLETNPHSCPGIAIGDFEQPNQSAYAILLVPNLESSSGYKIIIAVRATDANNYDLRLLDNGKADSGLVISRERPGKYMGFDETTSITLKLDGLNVEWLEKGSALYYYSTGSYHQLQTSD